MVRKKLKDEPKADGAIDAGGLSLIKVFCVNYITRKVTFAKPTVGFL